MCIFSLAAASAKVHFYFRKGQFELCAQSKEEWVKCSVELHLPHGIAQKDICFGDFFAQLQ